MDSDDSNPRFRPRFSVRTLLMFVTLVCVWLGWSIYSHRANYRQVCDQELDQVLLAMHWKAMEETANAKDVSAYLADELSMKSTCKTIFIRPDGKFTDGTAADTYEQDLTKSWQGNAITASGVLAEHADHNPWLSSSFVYYRAIRAKTICLGCHSTQNAGVTAASGNLPPAPLQVGDLIAIGRVQLAK